MNNLLLYFLKSAIAMALFYGVYRIFLEKETNYSLNRFYLVGTLILSMILPILPLENIFIIKQNMGMPVLFINLDDQGISASGIEISNAAGNGWRLEGIALVKIIYILGIGLLLSTLLYQFIRLIVLRKIGKGEYGPLKVVFVNSSILPFSILNRVFVDQNIRRDPKINTILDHEYAHFRNLHFIDLFLLEFTTIFQWFNPFIWLYIRSLKEIHEYQADDAVLRGGEKRGTYQALLVNQLTGTEVFRLSSGFSKSLTKKRMIMMTKIKSKKSAWLKALLALPVLAVLLIAYAANSASSDSNVNLAGDESYVIKGKVVEAETGGALPGVSVIWKGTTSGTVTDMNGDFSLAVNTAEPSIFFSFVGFQTTTVDGWSKNNITIRMNREVFKVSEDWKEEENQIKQKQSKEPEKIKDGEVFFIVEELPKFQGKDFNACRPWVQEHLEYPQKAKDNMIQGKVLVQFLVTSKGEVSKAEVVRGVDPLLDEAALKAVNAMPAWTPGKQRGKSVSTMFVIPVLFSL